MTRRHDRDMSPVGRWKSNVMPLLPGQTSRPPFQGSSSLNLSVDNSSVMRALGQLSDQLNEKARRVGIRRALRPFVAELRSITGTGPYRGKNTHRKAMAAATGIVIKRRGSGHTAPLVVQLGVRYGKRGGANARGRQRVFHLLEGGFKHFGSSQRYTSMASRNVGAGNTWYRQIDRDFRGRWTSPRFREETTAKGGRIKGSGRALRWAQSAIHRITDAMAREVLVEARKLLGGPK